MHCKPNGFRTATMAWFVLIVAWAGAPGTSAADDCELPDLTGGSVLNTSQFEEFRITLDPPDYGTEDAVRRHFVFSSTWGNMLTSELAARSQNACDLNVDPNIFPDLHAFLVGYRSAKGQNDFFEAVCVPLLRAIVHDWTPDETAVAKAVADLTRRGKWAKGLALSSRSYPFELAENALRLALARIYDENSVMHALVSIDTASYRTLSAGSFLAWIGQQQRGRPAVARLSLCRDASPRTRTGLALPVYKKRLPVFPPSTTAPAGDMTIASGEAGKDLPSAFQHVIIIGDDRPPATTASISYSLSPYARAVDKKYCGRRHMLDLGDNPARPTPISASIKCQFATILAFDDWMLLFCEDCGSARAAEAFAKLVINDPDLRAVKSSETDMKSKGPYLISFTARGQ